MLILTIMTVVSVLASAGISWGCGAFDCWQWLWMLPVGFAAVWLGLLLLIFLFVWIVCACVDTSKPQEEDSPFFRKMVKLFLPAVVKLLQVRIHLEGMEKLPKDGRFLLVCNHLDNMDPVLLINYFADSQLAFISKRENTTMFIVGKLMHKLLCQLINRENDREALKTILKCIQIIKEDKASIAVFPEGYTSRDHKLHHFRSGVFKIAQKADVPIVVCTVQNTYHVFHNAKRLRPTDVELHLVDVIPASELKGVTAVAIGERVHKLMADDLGPENVAD